MTHDELRTALAVTAIANTQANRRLTFGIRGRRGLARHHLAGLAVFVLALALTSGSLDVLHQLDAHPPRLLQALVLVLATLAATVSRYVALASWVFRRRPASPGRSAFPSLQAKGVR